MKESNETTWTEGLTKPKYPSLNSSQKVDVTIIGGGITGVVTAYVLSKAGKKVALLEKEQLGADATGATTAFLTQSIDTDTADLIKMIGKHDAKQVWDSHQHAIEMIEQIITDEKIECEFTRCRNYLYAAEHKQKDDLLTEQKNAAEIGIAMKFHSDGKLGFKNFGYLILENQAKFHAMKYLYGVADRAAKNGAMIFEKSEAKEITELKDGVFQVKTDRALIETTWVISATYAPFGQPKELFLKKAMYTSYLTEAEIPRGAIPEGIYEDMNNPYYYFRIDRGEQFDRLLLGGADHRADVKISDDKNYKAVEDYLRKTFLGLEYKITKRWDGPILEPVDGLALIGSLKEKNVLYATGFSGNGMTYSHIAARLFQDIIFENQNDLIKIYDARRLPSVKELALKGRDYVQEFFNGAFRNAFKYSKDSKDK